MEYVVVILPAVKLLDRVFGAEQMHATVLGLSYAKILMSLYKYELIP